MLLVNVPRLVRNRFPARKAARRSVRRQAHPNGLIGNGLVGVAASAILPGDYLRFAKLVYKHLLERELFTPEERERLFRIKAQAESGAKARGLESHVVYDEGYHAYTQAIAELLRSRGKSAPFASKVLEVDKRWWAENSPTRHESYEVVRPAPICGGSPEADSDDHARSFVIPEHDERDWVDYSALQHYDDIPSDNFPFGHRA